MTNTELEAWIAEHVMGWRETQNPDDHTTDATTLFWHRTGKDGREAVLVGEAYKHPGREIYSHSWKYFAPTDSPADAMAVLKKCLERAESFEIGYDESQGWYLYRELATCQASSHQSFELAICQFAKKLYEMHQR